MKLNVWFANGASRPYVSDKLLVDAPAMCGTTTMPVAVPFPKLESVNLMVPLAAPALNDVWHDPINVTVDAWPAPM